MTNAISYTFFYSQRVRHETVSRAIADSSSIPATKAAGLAPDALIRVIVPDGALTTASLPLISCLAMRSLEGSSRGRAGRWRRAPR